MYSAFTLTVNDFQVAFFSFNYQKQWKLSVCKKVINQVRVNGLYVFADDYFFRTERSTRKKSLGFKRSVCVTLNSFSSSVNLSSFFAC